MFFHTLVYADKNMKIGSKGKENEVSRIIKVVMYDNYYEPNSFQIKADETIKFEVENAGKLVHEFNIANKMMAKMDKSMGHSHSNSVLLEPKQKGNIIWKFDNAVNIEVACNVPGHYQAGMIAKVNIK